MIGGGVDEAIVTAVTRAVDAALEQRQQPIQRESLKVREAAEALGVSESIVRRLVHAGEIPSKKCGNPGVILIPLSGLRAWLNQADAA